MMRHGQFPQAGVCRYLSSSSLFYTHGALCLIIIGRPSVANLDSYRGSNVSRYYFNEARSDFKSNPQNACSGHTLHSYCT